MMKSEKPKPQIPYKTWIDYVFAQQPGCLHESWMYAQEELDEIRVRLATTTEGVIPNLPNMPIRAWLAGQVLAGLCANPGGPTQANGARGWGLVNCTIGDVGEAAAALADSTLKALGEAKHASEEGA